MKFMFVLAACALIVVITIIATFMSLHESNRRAYFDKYVTHAASIAPGAAEPGGWEAQVGPAVELYRLTQSLDEESLPAYLEAEIRLELGRHLADSGFRDETLAMLERGRELGEQSLAPDHTVRQQTEYLFLQIGGEALLPLEITSTEDTQQHPYPRIKRRWRRTLDWLLRCNSVEATQVDHLDSPCLEKLFARTKFVQKVRQATLDPGDPLLARSVIDIVQAEVMAWKVRQRSRPKTTSYTTNLAEIESHRASNYERLRDFESRMPDELGTDAAIDYAACLFALMRYDSDAERAIETGWSAVELVHRAHGDSNETSAALQAFYSKWWSLQVRFMTVRPATIQSITNRAVAMKERFDAQEVAGSHMEIIHLAIGHAQNQRQDIRRAHESGHFAEAHALLDETESLKQYLLSLVEMHDNHWGVDINVRRFSVLKARELRSDLLIREGRHAEALVILDQLSQEEPPLHGFLFGNAQAMIRLYRSWDEAEPGVGHDQSARDWTTTSAVLAEMVVVEMKQEGRSGDANVWQDRADEARASLEEDAGGD